MSLCDMPIIWSGNGYAWTPQAQTLTQALQGRWYGSYGLCFCPAHENSKTPALSLSDGTDGRLLARCHAGCSFTSILNAFRALGLIAGAGGYRPPDSVFDAQRKAEARAVAEKKARQARAVWHEALPIQGTIAERYLRARGITCALPETLRFHPACWHPTAKKMPAMVALVEGAGLPAVHRTYLRADGSGKADVTPAKAMLGQTRGCAVNFFKLFRPLVVAEGIETALSLASGLLGHPAQIWAALSTSGVAGVSLPEVPGDLIVAADGDVPGQEAAYKLACRAVSLGWNVSTLTAPDGRDWNDILMMKGGK